MPAGVREPVAGDLVVSEIMFNPAGPADDDGEWFEIHNTAADPVLLSQCTVADGALDIRGLAAPEVGAYIEAGGYLVFVRNPDVALNGGIANARGFSFGLTNSGDELVVKCGDVEMDRVDYSVDGFPSDIQGKSIQLDPGRLTPAANDEGQAWCHALETYPIGAGESGERGTPGAPNTLCGQ